MSYERYYSFFNSITVKKLYSLGYVVCPGSENDGKALDATDFTLLFCDGGSFTVQTGKKNRLIKKDRAIFLKKSDAFSIVSVAADTKILFAVFGADEALTAVPQGEPIKISVFGKTLLSRIATAAKSIYGEKYIAAATELSVLEKYLTTPLPLSENSDTESGQIVKNCLELLVLDHIKPAYKSVNSSLDEKTYMFESEKLAEKITALISENFKKNLTLQDLSDKLFFSKSYLKRVYKQQMGKGILQARTELKINRAKELLASGEKISDVARALGFSSINHFSAAFRKIAGVSPRDYKKSLHPL